MKTLRTIWLRIRSLWQRPVVKREIDEELRFHLEQRTAENLAAGMAPEEAVREARKRFGNFQNVREECHEVRGASFGETTWQDVRFGVRMLAKSPGFTAVAALSLALGIGAGTSIFSLVNAILLSSLPVPNPQELRLINWSGSDFIGHGWGGHLMHDASGHWTGCSVSVPVFGALREQCAAQADLFGYVRLFGGVTARAHHAAVRADGLRVSGNFFSGLGLRPVLGRLLGAEDEPSGAAPAVVLSYRWWQQQFDRDPGVLGQSVSFNGSSFTVVGVLPREFHGVTPGAGMEFYISLSAAPQLMPDVISHAPSDPWFVWLMARLKPGVSDVQCQAALNVACARAMATSMKQPAVGLVDGRAGPDEARGLYRKSLLMLLGMVGVVLLVVCANLAGLMLARGAARQYEFAVRAALGAGRVRLVRQSLTESLLVALLGGGLGIVFAVWGKAAVLQLVVPRQLHYAPSLDLRVLGFTLAVTLVTALLSGLMPALRAAGVAPLARLNDKPAIGTLRLRAGHALVVGQIALSLLPVAAGGLFVRTLVNLDQINPGFAMDHLLLFRLTPGDAGYREPQTTAFFERVQQSLVEIPGVRSVALTQTPPLSGGSWQFGSAVPGRVSEPVNGLIVSEGFFATMAIPIVHGRDLRPSDDDRAPKVVVVNEAFVHQYLPDRDPVGLQLDSGGDTDWLIVGVCRDAAYVNLKAGAQPTVHFSFRQYPFRFGAKVILRTALPPLALTTAARQVVTAVDPNIPLTEISTEEQVRDESTSQERMFATLCGSLAVLALLLSWIGLYGLMAYHIARRTREIGIRMALGATRRQIAGSVLRQAMLLAVTGVGFGLPLTLVLTRLISSILYGVAPSDPVTLSGAVVLLLMVAAAAAWLPARRAAKVDPLVALRYE